MQTLTVSSVPPVRPISLSPHVYRVAYPVCVGDHCATWTWLTDIDSQHMHRTATPAQRRATRTANGHPETIASSRHIATAVTRWSHANLFDPATPNLLTALTRRGLTSATISRTDWGAGDTAPSPDPRTRPPAATTHQEVQP